MKKPNPIEVKFKDKSKFNVQNPVVSWLITQVVDNKKKEKEILKALDQVPSIKDLNIEKRFLDLKNFTEGCNDDDDDKDDNNYCHYCLEETKHHFHLHHQFCQQLL